MYDPTKLAAIMDGDNERAERWSANRMALLMAGAGYSVSPQQINNWRLGKHEIPLSAAEVACRVAGKPVTYLLSDASRCPVAPKPGKPAKRKTKARRTKPVRAPKAAAQADA